MRKVTFCIGAITDKLLSLKDQVRRFRLTPRFAAMVLCAPLCFLAACSPNLDNLRRMVEPVDPASMQRRLLNVGLPLLIAAAGSCPFEQESTYGFLLSGEGARKGSQSPPSQNADKKAIVAYVHPRLAAASAGLVIGDRVVEVNAMAVEEEGADNVMRLMRRLTAARIQPLQLTVERAAERHTLAMWAVQACQFSLQLIESERINGFSNGHQVAVTTGALRTFVGDDELAWILAHEISHNLLSHAQNAKLQRMLNTYMGATVGSSAPMTQSPEPHSLEAQADYVGSYLMARAGYDLDAIRRVWNRLRVIESQQAALGHQMDQTHPTTDERLAAFEESLKEIEAKRRRGESLQPRLKDIP